jgi:transposase-like protein
VSTRKVDRLVEQMGLRGLSKDQVSHMCRGLDEQVSAFRERPLQGAYPYLWLDAKIEKVREPGGVRQKALVVAYAVHESGVREVIGLDVGEAETEAFWTEFLFSLTARGLSGVKLCVSDAHQGLRTAIARVLGCRWQRCTVHYADPLVMPSGLGKLCGGGRIEPVGVGIIRALGGRRGGCRGVGSGRVWRRAAWSERALAL